MAADIGRVYPTDLHLLKEELSAQGELLDRERLERKSEIDELRLQLEALKHMLAEADPEFETNYKNSLETERLNWNPELRRHG